MQYFSAEDIDNLKACVEEIIIDNNPEKQGFGIVLVLKDGRRMIPPFTFNLAEAFAFSIELRKLIGLSDERLKARISAIHNNRLNDITAFKISKLC
ncbi:MAG: hypothetical protein ABFC94_18650 [Syntrophomonas sp.]